MTHRFGGRRPPSPPCAVGTPVSRDRPPRPRGGGGAAWAGGGRPAVPDPRKGGGDDGGRSAGQGAGGAAGRAETRGAGWGGGSPRQYKHAYAGSVASLGLHKGVAEV